MFHERIVSFLYPQMIKDSIFSIIHTALMHIAVDDDKIAFNMCDGHCIGFDVNGIRNYKHKSSILLYFPFLFDSYNQFSWYSVSLCTDVVSIFSETHWVRTMPMICEREKNRCKRRHFLLHQISSYNSCNISLVLLAFPLKIACFITSDF